MKVIDELIEKKNTELAINKIDNLKPLMINAYGTALFDKSHKKQDWLVNRLRSSEEKIIRCNIEIAASHINNSRNFREKKQFAEVRKELELSNRHINISIKISKEYLFKELFSISLYYIQIINDEYNLLEREIQLEKANIAIVRNQFDDAIKIYSGFNMDEKVKELKLRKAKMFEDSMKYDAAVEIFDELGLTSEAARVRKLIARSRVPITKIEIETIDQSIQISDSVILRSNIGTKNEVPSPKI
jgi:tetratricopeptide (TPR) repeat protein